MSHTHPWVEGFWYEDLPDGVICTADACQTGQYKTAGDVPENSVMKMLPRFQPDVFDENMKLVLEVEKIATKKGCKPSQIAIGWILAHSGQKGMPNVIPIPGATTPERIAENMKPAKLDDDEMAALEEILKRFPPIGARYHEAGMKHAEL